MLILGYPFIAAQLAGIHFSQNTGRSFKSGILEDLFSSRLSVASD